MADELRIGDETGLTYTCEVRNITSPYALIGSAVSLTEDSSSGRYYGDFPSGSATDDTEYDLIYIQNSEIEATERRFWNGSALLTVDSRDVWTYASRTLTATATATTAALTGTDLVATRAVTLSATFSGTISATWTKAIFTAKADDCTSDAQSILQIVETNPADDGDGLQYIEGNAATAAQASLTVDQGAGTVVLAVSDDATAQLLLRAASEGATYDVKLILSDSTSSLFASGGFSVASTPTWAL